METPRVVSTLRSPSTRSGSCVRTQRELPEGIVTEAHRTHPVIGCSEARRQSHEYLDPEEFARGLDRAPLPEPPHGVAGSPSRRRPVSELRREPRRGCRAGAGSRSGSEAGGGGGGSERVSPRGRNPARAWTWIADNSLVCEVRDGGPGIDDPFAGYVVPSRRQAGRWALDRAAALRCR